MIKFIRFQIELLLGYIKKNTVFVIVGLLLGFVTFYYQDYLLNIIKKHISPTQYIGVEGMYTSQELPPIVSSQVSLGLTIYTDNLRPQISDIVDQLDIQNDNRDFIFTLKDNLYWHNSKKLTSKDVEIDFPGLQTEILNNQQIKISLQEPFSPILSILSQPLYLKNFIGLGPYKIVKTTYQQGYVKTIKIKHTQNGNSILYRFFPNENDLLSAFKLGQIDQIKLSQLPADLAKLSNIDIKQQIETDQKYVALFLNTSKLSDKFLRQALAYATPKTKDKNERCLGPISPLSWAYNPDVKPYLYNAQRAKELLSQNNQDIPEKIKLSVHDRRLLPLAEQIKNAWQNDLDLSVSITIENQINPDSFEAVLAYGGIPHDPDQYPFWHSQQSNTNLTRLNDPRIDQLLENGRLTFDLQERKKIYLDFQKYLLEDSPAIFLIYPTVYTISRI